MLLRRDSPFQTPALHVCRPLSPPMSSVLIIRPGYGQGSGQMTFRKITFWSNTALLNVSWEKALVPCCAVLARSMANLISTGKRQGIQLHLTDDTSNWNIWNAERATAKELSQGVPECSLTVFTCANWQWKTSSTGLGLRYAWHVGHHRVATRKRFGGTSALKSEPGNLIILF